MDKIIEEKLKIAKMAQKEWNALLHFSKPAPNDYIIVFPGVDREYNYYGLRYLDTFLQRMNGNQAILLTYDSYVKENASKLSRNIKSVVHCDHEQIQRLITLYELSCFDNRIVIISLDEPYCRNASGMIGVKGITVEQLVAIGIYSIIPFRPIADSENIV